MTYAEELMQGVDEVYGHGLLDLEQAFAQAESLAAM